MPLLFNNIPYLIKLEASRPSYETISTDYFVGGFPNGDTVEMGSFMFVKNETGKLNVTGRMFDSMTNITLY